MSFFSPPLGLHRRDFFARYRQSYANATWVAGDIVTCDPDPPYGAYVIYTMTATGVVMSADPGDMEFPSAARGFTDLSFAPFYSLAVTVVGPNRLTQWFDPPVCRIDPPFDYETDGPFASVAFDGTLLGPDGSAVSSTVDETGADANALTRRGYLLNPDPPWPSPDDDGNTFGSVLWTADQIPGVSALVYVERGPGGGVNPARIVVDLNPYEEGGPEPEGLAYQCVMGSV